MGVKGGGETLPWGMRNLIHSPSPFPPGFPPPPATLSFLFFFFFPTFGAPFDAFVPPGNPFLPSLPLFRFASEVDKLWSSLTFSKKNM